MLACFRQLEQQGYAVSYLPPNPQGFVTPQQVVEAVREDTVLLSLQLVNNETGVIFPVAEIAQAVKEKNPQVLVHCDGVQGFFKLPIALSGQNATLPQVDMLSVSGHKVHAPKGIGGLFLREGVKLPPLLLGGGQEGGKRSGTEPTHQMAGFAQAVAEGREHFAQRLVAVAERKREILQALGEIPQVQPLFQGDTPSVPHILPFSLVGYPSQVVLRCLDEQGICLSAGSACHRGGDSHVFASIPEKKVRQGALRLSLSHLTTDQEVEGLLAGLRHAVTTLLPSF